jgi:hypothetical protein
LYIFIGKEGQTAHVLDGSTAKSLPFSMIRPPAAAQMHADEQAERLRADGITAMVPLRSGPAEYAPLQIRLSDRNYRLGNEQDNMQGNTEEDDVQGNTKEDDAQDINDKNNYPTAVNAILLFCRPDRFNLTNCYVDDNSYWLVSILPLYFYTMTSHRDIYIYKC